MSEQKSDEAVLKVLTEYFKNLPKGEERTLKEVKDETNLGIGYIRLDHLLAILCEPTGGEENSKSFLTMKRRRPNNIYWLT